MKERARSRSPRRSKNESEVPEVPPSLESEICKDAHALAQHNERLTSKCKDLGDSVASQKEIVASCDTETQPRGASQGRTGGNDSGYASAKQATPCEGVLLPMHFSSGLVRKGQLGRRACIIP